MYNPVSIDVYEGKSYQLMIAPKASERNLTFEDAVLYCRFLDIDGFNDWRLPTAIETDVLYDSFATVTCSQLSDLDYEMILPNDYDFELEWYWTSNNDFKDESDGFGTMAHVQSRRFLVNKLTEGLVRAVRVIK
jgi:hypothetical protein